MATIAVSQDAAGRWRACAELPRDPGGPRRRVRAVGSTAGEARARVEARLGRQAVAVPEGDPWARRQQRLDAARELGHHTDADWWALYRSVGGRCYYCGIKTKAYLCSPHAPNYATRDHRVPLSRGGSNAIENMAVACRACNSAKGDLTEAEFRTVRNA